MRKLREAFSGFEIWISAAVLGLVALLIYSWARPEATIEVIRPKSGTIESYVEEQAVTELPTDYLVAMPIDGWLEPITLREGDSVKQGDLVASLDEADLSDQARQIEQRMASLEAKIREVEDHRLEFNALKQSEAVVISFDRTVEAAREKANAAEAVTRFAATEVERLRALQEVNASNDKEYREAVMEKQRSEAEWRAAMLDLAAMKTMQAVSNLGPKAIRDYIDRKSFQRESFARELEEQRAALQIAQRNLGRTRLLSPVGGRILERFQTRRQYLAAGTPILTIGRMEELEVVAEVLTERAAAFHVGDRAEIYGGALGDRTLEGQVSRIHPAGFKKISSLGVEQQRVKIAVAFAGGDGGARLADGAEQRGTASDGLASPIRPAATDGHDPQRAQALSGTTAGVEGGGPPAGLGVGFRIYVRLHESSHEGALIIPRSALFRGPRQGWEVMIIERGRTRVRPVEVGLLNDDQAEILKGLTAPDRVVAHPSRDIKENMHVAVKEIS